MKRFAATILVSFLLAAGFASQLSAGEDLPMRESLISAQGGKPYQPHIGYAKYRAAVFSLEDPQATGLGDAVALLLSRTVLFNSQVSSLGVLTFKKDLAPQEKGGLSYFDKVDLLTQREGVILSVWGRVLPIGDKLRIDLFLQVSPQALEQNFSWKLTLPPETGNKFLQAHLRPDRLHLQSLEMDKSAAAEIAAATESLLVLRRNPWENAKIVGRLPEGKIFSISYHHTQWVKVVVRGGPVGYLPNPSHFTNACQPLVEAGRFAAGLLYCAANGNPYYLKPGKSLSPEARAIRSQLSLFDWSYIRHLEKVEAELLSSLGASKEVGGPGVTPEKRLEPPPPVGASFANLLAITRFGQELNSIFQDKLAHGLPRQTVQDRICQAVRRHLEEAKADQACSRLSQALQRYPTRLSETDMSKFFASEAWYSIKTHKQDIENDFVASLAWQDLDKGKVKSIADELARASLDDPNNLDVLHNLGVFFALAGDTERLNLAESLVKQLTDNK